LINLRNLAKTYAELMPEEVDTLTRDKEWIEICNLEERDGCEA
jgi:hypothetical protein